MDELEKDRKILRELAARIAEIAALPVQEEKRRLWSRLNSLEPERPMVCIDQVCWNEMNYDGSLTLLCSNAECRKYEEAFRRTLFQWKNFPVDLVVEPFIKVEKAIRNTMFGMSVEEHTLATDKTNSVLSHKFVNQFTSVDDVMNKVKMPEVSHDAAETKRRMDFASWLFDGILPLHEYGYEPYLSIWDPISRWMSVEGALYGLADNPDMMHALVKRMADGYMIMLDQMEEQGLLCHHQALVAFTGAFTDELPASGFDPKKPRTKDVWGRGQAQMFVSVSPAMLEEFEINNIIPLYDRFGLTYYGCCEPLDERIHLLRKIPHLRKISMSPWAKRERGAESMGGDFVFSNKPNPAFLAGSSFNEDLVRKDLETTRDICKRYGCPLEFIFKDISTMSGDPRRLKQEAEIAMKIVQE
ncbi:MAG: hypothetical protein LBN21_05910 [Treponema sp.]|jgi:hypothetical protein|nr:hypothetical protein [Treponema sp.]